MIESSDLLRIRYFNNDFKERENLLFTRSFFLEELKGDLGNWNYERYRFPLINKIKRETIHNTLKMSSKITSSFKNRKKLWVGSIFNKYNSLFKTLPYNLIISEIEPSPNSIFHLILTPNITLGPIYQCYADLYSGILTDDKDLLQQGLDKLKTILRGINPDLIILESDHIPIHRSIAIVARELGIPTVEIQHGIYMSDFLPTGREVDYVFVWGNYFKDLYLKNKIKKPGQIKILGYPYPIEKYNGSNKEKKHVTYLGQNFEAFNKDFISTKVETVQSLQKICDELNFDFSYRPHPKDNLTLLKSKLKNITFTPYGETLQETMEKGDIFISFNSTALVEANLHSKLGIQLKNYDIPADNLEKIGACSKSVETLEELKSYLEQIKNNDLFSFYGPVNKNYIEIPSPDPGTKFLELLGDII